MRHVPAIWGTLDPFVESDPVIGRKVAKGAALRQNSVPRRDHSM